MLLRGCKISYGSSGALKGFPLTSDEDDAGSRNGFSKFSEGATMEGAYSEANSSSKTFSFDSAAEGGDLGRSGSMEEEVVERRRSPPGAAIAAGGLRVPCHDAGIRNKYLKSLPWERKAKRRRERRSWA